MKHVAWQKECCLLHETCRHIIPIHLRCMRPSMLAFSHTLGCWDWSPNTLTLVIEVNADQEERVSIEVDWFQENVTVMTFGLGSAVRIWLKWGKEEKGGDVMAKVQDELVCLGVWMQERHKIVRLRARVLALDCIVSWVYKKLVFSWPQGTSHTVMFSTILNYVWNYMRDKIAWSGRARSRKMCCIRSICIVPGTIEGPLWKVGYRGGMTRESSGLTSHILKTSNSATE